MSSSANELLSDCDLYTLDDEALRRCDPDLILSQDLCRVCAVASGDVAAATARLNCHADVLQIDPQTLTDVLDSVETIASAARVAKRGAEYVAALRRRLADVEATVRDRPRRRVFVLEWIDPPFGAGHWVPDLVVAAGGEPVLARHGERSVSTSWPAIAAAQPDVDHRRAVRLRPRASQRTGSIDPRPRANNRRGLGH